MKAPPSPLLSQVLCPIQTQRCHPDRGEAKWRDVLFIIHCIQSQWKRHPPLCHPKFFVRSKQKCHPDRSEAKWRDLLFIIHGIEFGGKRCPPLCHPERNRGGCGFTSETRLSRPPADVSAPPSLLSQPTGATILRHRLGSPRTIHCRSRTKSRRHGLRIERPGTMGISAATHQWVRTGVSFTRRNHGNQSIQRTSSGYL